MTRVFGPGSSARVLTRVLAIALALGASDTANAAPRSTTTSTSAASSSTSAASSSTSASSSSSAASTAKPRPKAKRKRPRQPRVRSTVDGATTPAYRYGAMSGADCEAELVKRGISFASEPSPGVLAPVRLTGPLRGVTFRTNLSESARAVTRWEIADCRLVLALDDFAAMLASHDIVEVRHYSMYRPPSKRWPDGRIAGQHAGALALDAALFIDRDGNKIDVDDDWHGRIGARTCGPDARPRRKTPASLKLRELLCETASQRLFNVILTPNHNRGHKNHFHLEVTAGVRWFIVD